MCSRDFQSDKGWTKEDSMTKNDLIELNDDLNTIKIPDDHIWHCDECDWRGLVQDCETESEPVGFIEGPWYEQPICPKCGCGVDV
jgi:hypothetical protein